MATNDEFLAFLRVDNAHISGEVEDTMTQQQQRTSSSSFPLSSGSVSVSASPSICKLPPKHLDLDMKVPPKKHARSRSELPSSLPMTLSEQLLMSYSKPKRHVQFTKNAQWNSITDLKQQIHPLKTILREESSQDIIDKETSSRLLADLSDASATKASPSHRRSKTCTLDAANDINVGGRLMPAEDLLRLTNLDLATASQPVNHGSLRPLFTPRRVYQNKFVRGKGNAIQAAVASIFGLTLLEVPNFIEMSERYEDSITKFYSDGSGGHGKCIRITLENTGCKDTTCRDMDHTTLNGPDEIRRNRSPEENERVAVITENCMTQIYSVLNDKRITMSQLEGFNQRLNELVQGTLLSLSAPKNCNCVANNSRQYAVPDKFNNKICILRGKSPRGDFGHTVVARHLSNGKFEMLHDPYPDGDFLDRKHGYDWCLFFVE
jgi:hypothetical protein